MSHSTPPASASQRRQEATAKLDGAPEAQSRPRPPARPISPLKTAPPAEPKTLCDRCGEEMYRMHAVWRCPACGFKTDCCGW